MSVNFQYTLGDSAAGKYCLLEAYYCFTDSGNLGFYMAEYTAFDGSKKIMAATKMEPVAARKVNFSSFFIFNIDYVPQSNSYL